MAIAFTVLVTTRDRPLLLADALASIAAQTLPPLEIRLVDTGAHPAPVPALSVPLHARHAPGKTAAEARNLAAEGAKGQAIAFLDDDDRWLPDHLAGLGAALSASAIRFAFRDSAVIQERLSPEGRREELGRREIGREWDDALMRTDDFIPPSAWGVQRTLLEELGGFDTAYRFSDDWDFLLRARALTVPRRVPGITAEVRMRESGNASADFGPERLADLHRLEQRHGLGPLVLKTFWEVAETVKL